jgi:hypothetical protein
MQRCTSRAQAAPPTLQQTAADSFNSPSPVLPSRQQPAPLAVLAAVLAAAAAAAAENSLYLQRLVPLHKSLSDAQPAPAVPAAPV